MKAGGGRGGASGSEGPLAKLEPSQCLMPGIFSTWAMKLFRAASNIATEGNLLTKLVQVNEGGKAADMICSGQLLVGSFLFRA